MYQEILNFWFDEIDSNLWWEKDTSLDQLIRDRFQPLHDRAIRGELFGWREYPEGRLAEIILLDQFSRNMYRDTSKAFLYDVLALALAQEAIKNGDDTKLSEIQSAFMYLPLMHSESLLIHEEAVRLYENLGSESHLNFEHQHKAIIERFGRYPHRNIILGRASTKEEIAFLNEPGSSF